MTNPLIAKEEILGAFAMEFGPQAGVLERYLARYPEYSLQLVDLSRELLREFDDSRPLSVEEIVSVNASLRRLQEHSATIQSLQEAPTKLFTDAAKVLELPMQAGLALRERRIAVSTIPVRILEKLAQALQASVTVLHSYLALPPQISQLRASKSSVKPTAAEKVSFERVLREAGMDEKSLSKLISSD